jgi:UPF0716 family protein affecting phage T7 exclusion
MFGLAAGLEGFMLKKVAVPFRLMAVAGGLFLIYPGLVSDLVGLSFIAAVAVVQGIGKKINN